MPRSRIRYRYITAYKKNPIQKNKINIPCTGARGGGVSPRSVVAQKGEPRTSAADTSPPPLPSAVKSKHSVIVSWSANAGPYSPHHSPHAFIFDAAPSCGQADLRPLRAPQKPQIGQQHDVTCPQVRPQAGRTTAQSPRALFTHITRRWRPPWQAAPMGGRQRTECHNRAFVKRQPLRAGQGPSACV